MCVTRYHQKHVGLYTFFGAFSPAVYKGCLLVHIMPYHITTQPTVSSQSFRTTSNSNWSAFHRLAFASASITIGRKRIQTDVTIFTAVVFPTLKRIIGQRTRKPWRDETELLCYWRWVVHLSPLLFAPHLRRSSPSPFDKRDKNCGMETLLGAESTSSPMKPREHATIGFALRRRIPRLLR